MSTRDVVSAIYEGDEDKAAQALQALLQPQQPDSALLDQLTAQVADSLRTDEVLDRAAQRHPEVFADPDLASAADGRVSRLLRQGVPLARAIPQAVSHVAQRFTTRPASAAEVVEDEQATRSAIIREMASRRI